MRNFTVGCILTMMLVGSFTTIASADGLITGLSWKGGKPEVLAASNIGEGHADFFFDYRFRVLDSFLPAEVEVRLNYLILTHYNPLEPDALNEIERLLAPYDIRIQILRGRKLLAECRNKYVSFSTSLDEKTGEKKDAEITPGNSSVGSEHGRVSKLDSAFCMRPASRKKIIPAVRRNDRVRLVYGKNSTEIAVARFKSYPFK
jgi:hypothetical protein